MGRTIIVGDGPAGLSAALLLAKNGHETLVYGRDATLLHHAHLHNYLGVLDTDGSTFQATSRAQVEAVGARLVDAEVVGIEAEDGGGFTVRTADETLHADHVLLAGGRSVAKLAAALGAASDDGAVTTDGDAATSVAGLYAAGHLVRPQRSQAIISAGDGAKAALDILSREAGEDVHDWDSPPST
ncbi:MAG: FAD-dependent oxidoreductase [Nitriliruptoraceae bacterium]